MQRITWLLVGLALIGLVMMISFRLGGSKAAVVAGLLVAVSPLAILTSSTVMVDGFGTTWATLSVFLSIEGYQRNRTRLWLTGSAIAAGLAAATKIPYGSAVLASLAVVTVTSVGSTRRWTTWVRNTLPVVIAFPLTFALVSPNALKWPRDFLETLMYESRHYAEGVDGSSAEPWLEQFLVQVRSGWVPNFGFLALGLAVLGLVLGLRNPQIRIPVIVLVVPTLPVVLVFMSGRLTYHRTLIFTYPAIAVLAGLAATLIARWVQVQLVRNNLMSVQAGRRASLLVWMVISAVTVAPNLLDEVAASRYWWTQQETRTVAFHAAAEAACTSDSEARIVWQRALVPNGPHLNNPCPQVDVLLSPLNTGNELVSGDVLIYAEDQVPDLPSAWELQSIPGTPLRPINELGVPIGPTENPAIQILVIE